MGDRAPVAGADPDLDQLAVHGHRLVDLACPPERVRELAAAHGDEPLVADLGKPGNRILEARPPFGNPIRPG